MNNLSDIITITNKISEKKNILIILFLQMKTKNNWIFFSYFLIYSNIGLILHANFKILNEEIF